jgi:hypothetical protein
MVREEKMAVENVKLGGMSPEEVAYKLMWDVSSLEEGFKNRKALLDAYAECLQTVRMPINRLKKS